SIAERIKVVSTEFERIISDLTRVDTLSSLVALEWLLGTLINRIGIPRSLFATQFAGELTGYFIAHRYNYPFNFTERQQVLERLEKLTGVPRPSTDPLIARGRVMEALEMMQTSRVYTEEYDFDLRPYLQEHRTLILEPKEKRSSVVRVALMGVERLANSQKNQRLPEQIQALHELGLSFEVDEEHKFTWLHNQVRQQGLLFDPQGEALRLDARCYTGFGQEFVHQHGKTARSEGPLEMLSSQLIEAYDQSPEGWNRIAKILEESEVSGEEKKRLIRTLIHCIDIPLIEFTRHHSKGVRTIIRNDLQNLLEGITNLPFSKEEVHELFQELYATYLLQQGEFLDSDLLQNVPPLQLTHPSIVAARVRLTKNYLLDSVEATSRDGLLSKPARLLLSEWPDTQRQEFLASLEERDPDFGSMLQNRGITNQDTDEQQASHLEQIFSHWISGQVSMPELTQILIAQGDTIDRFCKTFSSFRASYETLLAKIAGRAEFPLLYTEKKLREFPERFSARGCEQVIEDAVHSGEWSVVEAILQRYPKRSTRLLQRLKKEIVFRLPEKLADSRAIEPGTWLGYVVAHYPEILIQEQKKQDFPWEGYQELLGIIYEYKLSTANILSIAPGIKIKHKSIQKAFASASLEDLLSRGEKSFRPEALQVNWSDAAIRGVSIPKLRLALPTLQRLKGDQGVLKPMIEALKTIQDQTGYHLADPVFYPIKSFYSLKDLAIQIERWEGLVALLGEGPTDRVNFRKALQEQIDNFCIRGVGTADEYHDVQKRVQLIPSDEALRGYVMKACYASPEGALKSGELLKVVGRTVELSAEQIRAIPKGTPRAEALIYTLVLPKQGPERVAAEKAYKERSELAALMPQLLAIQSPTKRTAFCPYEHGLAPLLRHDARVLNDAASRRGLLIFLKEFGMQYLPKLALAVIELAINFEHPEKHRETVALVRYRELLGVGQEQWTMEQYLAKTHELIQAIRQTILEDKPLESRIEQSPIGMELFNAVVPHAGSYFSLDDRPRLLALTRTHADSLVVDPWYKPMNVLVDVAEQEQAIAGAEEASPVERAIKLRQEQIKKKYQDETMLRFMKGWEESARLMELEPTGKSPSYWFSIVRDRIDAQGAALQQKQAGIKNTQGVAAIEKKRARLMDMSERLLLLMKQDTESDPEGQSVARRLEELQSVFVTAQGKVDRVELESQAGDVARALTLSMMYDHSPQHYEAVQRAGAEQTEKTSLSPSLLKAWETWFREEYLEHFAGFNPEVDVPLTAPTRLLLQKLWRIDGLEGDIVKMRAGEKDAIPMTHPLIGPFTNIRRLEEEIHQLERTQRSGNQQPLQFWPVKRIGRVLAGDIANACYNSRRHGLAQGDEKKITALLMTIPGETEIAGSTLLIDTRTRSGKRALVIRALNPTEAVIRKSLDARAVVEATIEYAKGVARATAVSTNPIQEVRLCYDHRGGHSTNREEVFAAETKLVQEHKWTIGEDLENVTETNFNGYNVHDRNQTRVVWRTDR
ncbi:hypothetical protein KBA73_03275, partial [Patescibacteria group bacterium]|nr:hypothetical protein [Patescibacteria group bacterium]